MDILVQTPGSPKIYVVSGGAKRLIPTMEAFEGLGYDPAAIRQIPAGVLAQIPDAVDEDTVVQALGDGFLVRAPATSETHRRQVPPQCLQSAEVTERLYARLDDADLAEVESRLSTDDSAIWNDASALGRNRLALAFGVHYGVHGVLAKTGLSDAVPPDDVHAMARGPRAAGGSYDYADLVVDALIGVGAELLAGARGLDFGCSSGRVVRVLAAAYPDFEWYACDPNGDAIRWARRDLRRIRFAVSPGSPPLSYSDGFFDLVFAISIWSHFAESAALQWFDEMRRIIRPGGHLVLTSHGYQSIAHCADHALRSPENLADIREALYSRGFWFAPEFGERGDWGIVHPEWGTAFLTTEWLLANLCPRWLVADFAIGRAEGNQDLIVLKRP